MSSNQSVFSIFYEVVQKLLETATNELQDLLSNKVEHQNHFINTYLQSWSNYFKNTTLDSYEFIIDLTLVRQKILQSYHSNNNQGNTINGSSGIGQSINSLSSSTNDLNIYQRWFVTINKETSTIVKNNKRNNDRILIWLRCLIITLTLSNRFNSNLYPQLYEGKLQFSSTPPNSTPYYSNKRHKLLPKLYLSIFNTTYCVEFSFIQFDIIPLSINSSSISTPTSTPSSSTTSSPYPINSVKNNNNNNNHFNNNNNDNINNNNNNNNVSSSIIPLKPSSPNSQNYPPISTSANTNYFFTSNHLPNNNSGPSSYSQPNSLANSLIDKTRSDSNESNPVRIPSIPRSKGNSPSSYSNNSLIQIMGILPGTSPSFNFNGLSLQEMNENSLGYFNNQLLSYPYGDPSLRLNNKNQKELLRIKNGEPFTEKSKQQAAIKAKLMKNIPSSYFESHNIDPIEIEQAKYSTLTRTNSRRNSFHNSGVSSRRSSLAEDELDNIILKHNEDLSNQNNNLINTIIKNQLLNDNVIDNTNEEIDYYNDDDLLFFYNENEDNNNHKDTKENRKNSSSFSTNDEIIYPIKLNVDEYFNNLKKEYNMNANNELDSAFHSFKDILKKYQYIKE